MEAARRKRELQGLAWGFIGVAIFSLTLPATRVAVVELDPVLVGLGRSLAASVLAPDAPSSFAALLLGFGLSEMWRAPAAVMVRDVSPPELGSTGSALHLCARNVLGGAGPLLVAVLSERVGLQTALLLVPVCFATSGVAFFFAERVLAEEKARTAAESAVVAVAADAGGGAPR